DSSPPYISTDESKIRQIIVNLVNNAVKYTREGTVEVRAWIERDHLNVEIEDTGEGIAVEDIERIFKPFERCEGDTEQEEGTGLGLAISRQVAQLLGGDITATSEIGVGSTFRLNIPVLVPAEGQVQVLRPGDAQVIGIEGEPARILIVDDNREAARLLGQFLESLGFVVKVVFDGATAVANCNQWRPDIILLDQRMPQMDGIEVARQIRGGESRNSKIVLVSASVKREAGPTETDLVDGYLSKPCDLEEELLKEISRLTGVAYRYSAETTNEPQSVEEADLDTLVFSESVREELESAILKGDIAQILEVLDELHDLTEATKAYIRNMALQFKYDALLTLVQDSRRHAGADG
ncbi:MAG: ATP-binding protein, partial [Pseudomonadota bacterium]